jgi:hypothetical protein
MTLVLKEDLQSCVTEVGADWLSFITVFNTLKCR